jgi:hypothetical protein
MASIYTTTGLPPSGASDSWSGTYRGCGPVKRSLKFTAMRKKRNIDMVNLYTIPSSVADPDPGSGDFLTPGSGMNNPDHIYESLETIFLG